MGYELYLVPVPSGAEVEEAGEALVVRLTAGHEWASTAAAGQELVARLLAADPELARQESAAADSPLAGAARLETPSGVRVLVSDRFACFSVAYVHQGEAATAVFERVFALAGLAADATGWRLYDPQDAAALLPDDAGRDATLEVYLSVMDQLHPAPLRAIAEGAPTGIANGGSDGRPGASE